MTLFQNTTLTLVSDADAPALAAAYRRNRNYLAPWEPLRPDAFFTKEGQRSVIEAKLALFRTGSEVPWVLADGERIIGTITLTGIVRGPFLSANLGYWIDGEYAGRGLGTAAVTAVVETARKHLGLHRIQAATLLHNAASQRILDKSGFERIGMAPQYLKIADRWQDHLLFQRILEAAK
ncbi:GNAT family N-acetyltransferase [Arthrobacter sunyaminii]|uniref:GNAT family N-acetyltransferase n=1 Tax=Arthrobacter sunyaminii TaxID=2816859 RepID=UPI003557D900